MNRGRVAVVATILVALATACDDGTPQPEKTDPVAADEAAAFAKRFEAAIEPCEGAKLEPLLDLDTILRRAAHAADIKKAEREQVYKGMHSVKGQLAGQLCASFPADIKFELLRIRELEGRPTPIFRGVSAGGVNYYELELAKSKADRQVRIVDMYMYVAGERLSDTFAKLATAGVAVTRRGGDVSALSKIGEAHRAGDDAEARRLIDGLPAKLRNTKQVRLIELQIVTYDHPDYRRLIEDFEKAFPDDPAIDMISVDGAFMRKDMKGVLAALDRLDRRVGGDPYLGFLRSGAYQLEPTAENLAAAEEAVRHAATAMPDDENVHLGLLSVLLLRRDFPAVVTALNVLETRFGKDINPDRTNPEPAWQAFFASAEYAAWAANR